MQTRITVRLPKQLDEQIEQEKRVQKISKNKLIVAACKKLIEEYEKQNEKSTA